MKPWQRLSKEVLIENPWFRISYDRYSLPHGETGEYTYVDIPGSTMIVPVLDDGRIVMVRQHRYLIGKSSLELPAGGIKRGFEPLENARAELREETGFHAGQWTAIGAFAPYNGVSNEMCHVFVARDLRAGEAAPEPTEDLEIVHRTLPEIRQDIASGVQWDGMTIASIALYEAWRDNATAG